MSSGKERTSVLADQNKEQQGQESPGPGLASLAAALGPLGLAALFGVGPRGRAALGAARELFPAWTQKLHDLPVPGFISGPRAKSMDALADVSALWPNELTARMKNVMQTPGLPVGEHFAEGLLPAMHMRVGPSVVKGLEEKDPRAAASMAHELVHLGGGMENMNDLLGLIKNPENITAKNVYRLYSAGQTGMWPNPENHLDDLMLALGENNKMYSDIPNMYRSYRSDFPPSTALSENIAEILGRKKALEVYPNATPKQLQGRWQHNWETSPQEFPDQIAKLALQRLKAPTQ